MLQPPFISVKETKAQILKLPTKNRIMRRSHSVPSTLDHILPASTNEPAPDLQRTTNGQFSNNFLDREENNIDFLPELCSTPVLLNLPDKPREIRVSQDQKATHLRLLNSPSQKQQAPGEAVLSQHALSEILKRQILKPDDNQDGTQPQRQSANTTSSGFFVRVRDISELMPTECQLRIAMPKSRLLSAAETQTNAPATISSTIPTITSIYPISTTKTLHTIQTATITSASSIPPTTLSTNSITTTTALPTVMTKIEICSEPSNRLVIAQDHRDKITLGDDCEDSKSDKNPLNSFPGHCTNRFVGNSGSSSEVLDSKGSPNKYTQDCRTQQTKTVPNKPCSPATNGELFSAELKQLSNNEAASQLKSSSQNMQVARKPSALASEVRRSLSETSDGLLNQDIRKDSFTQTLKQSAIGRKPLNRRKFPMTKELQNYLKLSENVATRLKSSVSKNTKRVLYTEDDFFAEDTQCQLPKSHRLTSDNTTQIVPEPPSTSRAADESCEQPITRMQPPPTSSSKSKGRIQSSSSGVASKSKNYQNINITDVKIIPPRSNSTSSITMNTNENSTTKKLEDAASQSSKDTDKESVHMEELTPPSMPQPSPTLQAVLDSQPSTSPTAGESLEQSIPMTPPSTTSSSENEERIDLQNALASPAVLENTNKQNINIIDVTIIPAPSISTSPLTTKENENADPQNSKDVDQENYPMEELRMLSLTPPPITKLSPTLQDVLDSQPSSSHAARKALEQSQQQNRSKETTSSVNESVLTDIQESNTEINMSKSLKRRRNGNKSFPTINDDSLDDGDTVKPRRSERGHIPLRNTWCHTLADPFAFMRKTESKSCNPKPKTRRTSANKSFSEVKRQLIFSTPKDKGDLNDSDKREHDKKQRKSQIEVVDEPEDQNIPKAPFIRPNKRKAPKTSPKVKPKRARVENVDDLSKEISVADTDEVACANALVPEPDLETDQSAIQGHNDFMNWLRGSENIPPGCIAANGKSDSIVFMPSSHLRFSLLDGIEYAFYTTEINISLGYMRFQAMQEQVFKTCKSKFLQLVVIYGQFNVQICRSNSKDLHEYVLNTGDLIEINFGNRYKIKNTLNEVSVFFINHLK